MPPVVHSSKQQVPGYSYYSLNFRPSRNREGPHSATLLVPDHLVEALDREEDALEKTAKERFASTLLGDKSAVPASNSAPRNVTSAAAKPSKKSRARREPVAGQNYDPTKQHPVYQAADVIARLENPGRRTPDRDFLKHEEELFGSLRDRGPLRKIGIPDHPEAALGALRREQPNFAAVVDLVAHRLAAASATKTPLRIPPLLLTGDPGVGKTHFSLGLARALGTQMRRQAYDTDVTAAALLGADRKWANTYVGLVFELLALGDYANPIVVLDEIDKAGRDFRQDPLAPLHTLLEPATAGKVRDISADLEVDASLVIWICTANRPERIPETVRSRLTQFHIQPLDAAEALQVAPKLIAQACRRLGVTDLEPPGRAIVALLAHLSPRELIKAAEQAIACAIADQRRYLRLQDLPAELRANIQVRADGLLH